MDGRHTYRITVAGRIDERELNAASPCRVTADGSATTTTRLTAVTDQSGLIGLVRHLHGRGLVLLAVYRES